MSKATDLGIFTDSGYFIASMRGRPVAYLDMEFLHAGVPQMKLQAKWEPPQVSEPQLAEPSDYSVQLQAVAGQT